jgi:hypothetical protein
MTKTVDKPNVEKEIINITNHFVSKHYRYYHTINGKEERYFDEIDNDILPSGVRKEEQIVFHFETLKEMSAEGKYVFERVKETTLYFSIEKRFIKNPSLIGVTNSFGILAEVSYFIKKSKVNYPKRGIKIGDVIFVYVGLKFLPEIDISQVIIINK